MFTKFLTSLLLLIFLSASKFLWAQGEATMLFLRISPSPMLNSMGEVGTALPVNDALGFFYNPAQLGYTSQNTNFAFQFYPTKTAWLPNFNIEGLTYNSLAINLGYNFKNSSNLLPISVGLGYMRGAINYGKNVYTDDEGNVLGIFASNESYSAFGIGVGIDYYINFNVGLTTKRIKSELSPVYIGQEWIQGKADAGAIDYGVLMVVPVLKYFQKKSLNTFNSNYSVLPYFNLSLGYAKTNIGDKVSYIDVSQADPIPRTAQLGFALSGGLDLKINENSIRAIGVDWSVDANDMLVLKGREHNHQTGLLGDISFWDNLLSGKSDENVDIHKGYRLQLFEFLQISSGEFDGNGWDNPKTSGFTVSLKGVLKAAAGFSKNKSIEYLARHFELQYARSKVNSGFNHPLTGTTHKSILLAISGF